MAYTFRFRWIPFLATVIAVALGVQLGRWQTHRATEKERIAAMQAEREAAAPVDLGGRNPAPEDPEYRRAIATGRFRPDWTIYLENRQHQGMPGFYVLMPLQLAGTNRYLLVARGWVRRDPADRLKLPDLRTPAEQVRVEGVLRRNPGHLLQLGAPSEIQPGAVLQNIDIAHFASASKLDMLPFMMEQTSENADGLVRDWPRPSAGSERNRGYAFQWYGLALTAFAFFIVTGFKRGKR